MVLDKAIGKIAKKVMDTVSEGMTGEIAEALSGIFLKVVQLLDIDSQPEIKIKLFNVKAIDYETHQKESFVCIGFRLPEPIPLEDRIRELQHQLAKTKKT